MSKPIYRYKFLREGLQSQHGVLPPWKVGEWRTHEGSVDMCNAGFHCSKGAYQAFSYVQGEVLAVVEVKGKHETQADKEVWEQMRTVKAYKWTQKDSILFSCFAARLVLRNYESLSPDDDRVRGAIEAAETYALEPSDANKEAARSAARSAAWSAEAAKKKLFETLDKWMADHIKNLEEIK